MSLHVYSLVICSEKTRLGLMQESFPFVIAKIFQDDLLISNIFQKIN